MSKRIKGITIELGVETTGLSRALGDVEKRSRDINKELRDVNNLLRFNPDNAELLAQKHKLLSDHVEAAREKLDKLKEAEAQVQEQFQKGEISEEQYRAFQREIVETESKLKHYKGEIENLNKEKKTLGERLQDLGPKISDVGEKMSKAGTKLTVGLTVPITALATASMLAWKDVDNSLDDIVKATGATGDELENLHGVWEQVVTTMPIDMAAASDAVGELNTQFGTFGDELEDQTRKTVMFSEITGQDVVGAVQGAKKAIELFNLDADDYGRVLDAAAKAGQDTGVSVDKIWDAVRRGAPALKELDLDVEESIVFLARLEQSGLDANKALGYLGRAEAALAKDGKTLGEGLAEFNELVQSGAGRTEKLNRAAELFGTRGAVFMLEAAEQGALDFNSLAEAASGAAGTVEDTFNATLDPIDSFKTVMNNAKIAGAELGESIQIAAAPMIEKLVGFVQDLTQKFKELTPEQQETIIKLGAILAAVGPVLTIGGKLVSKFGDLTSSVGKFAEKLSSGEGVLGTFAAKMGGPGPLMLAGAAVAAAAALAITVAKMWEVDPAVKEARKAVDEFTESTKNATGEAFGQARVIEDMRDELYDLTEVEGKSATEKARIEEIVKRLNTLMPELNLQYEKETDQLNLTKQAIDDVIDAHQRRLIEVAKGKIMAEWEETYGDILTDIFKKQSDLNILNEASQKLERALNDERLEGLSDYDIRMAMASDAAREHNKWNRELTEDQITAIEELRGVWNDVTRDVTDLTDHSVDSWSSVTHTMDNLGYATGKLEDDIEALNSEIGRGEGVYESQLEAIDDFMDGMFGLGKQSEDTADQIEEDYDRMSDAAEDTADRHSKVADDMEDGYDRMAESAEDSTDRQQKAQEELEKATDKHKNSMNSYIQDRFDYEKGTVKEFLKMWEEELEAFQNYQSNMTTIAAKVGPEVAGELEKLGPQAAPLIKKFAEASNEELEKLVELYGLRTGAAVDAAKREVDRMGDIGRGSGRDLMSGMSGSINENSGLVSKAARNAANVAANAIRKVLQISSPSKIGKELGRNFAESLGLGIDEGEDKVEKDARELAKSIIDASRLEAAGNIIDGREAFAGVGRGMSTTYNGGDIVVQNMTVRDDQDIRLIAQELHRLQTGNRRARGVVS